MQSNSDVRMSPAVQGILKAARKDGELAKAGVLGRLGDLATIPDKYDVAISTACGHVNSIVVQTTAGAEQCLKYAHKYKLGRVTCIPMDKTKKGAHDRVVETPEGAPRLYDLINPVKPFLAPAIFLAISDTLVAPDIDTANRWAFESGKRWRVVTVDGKLFETSGTMSGGGTRVSRGGMRLASGRSKMALGDEEEDTEADVKRFEQEAAKIQNDLQECRKLRKELVDEIRVLKKNVKVLEAKLPKLTVEIDGCDTTRKELTKFIPELRTQVKLSDSDESKLVDLNKKVAMCKTDMSSCALKASKLEAEIARLQKAIMDAGGSKLKKQQDACDKALSKLDAAEKALNMARVSITSNTKAATKADKARQEAEDELTNCLAKLEELQDEFKLLEADAFKVMEVYEKAKSVEAEAKILLEEASKECEELKKSQSEKKCVEVELVGKIEDLVKLISESERKRSKWDSDLAKLRGAAEEDDYDLDGSDDEGEKDRRINADDGGEDDAMKDNDGDIVDSNDANESRPRSVLPIYSPDALERYEKDDILNDISVLEHERNTIAKNANMGAIAEYRKKEADYLSRYVVKAAEGSHCACMSNCCSPSVCSS
jgi:structural maintenance of chromosome 4